MSLLFSSSRHLSNKLIKNRLEETVDCLLAAVGSTGQEVLADGFSGIPYGSFCTANQRSNGGHRLGIPGQFVPVPYSIVNLLTGREWIGLSVGHPWVVIRKILSRLRLGEFHGLELQQDWAALGEGAFGVGGGWRGGPTYNGIWRPATEKPILPSEYLRSDPNSGCWVWVGPRSINDWTPERILVAEREAILFGGLRVLRTCQDNRDVCINPEHLSYWRRVQGELKLCLGCLVLPPCLGGEVQPL